MIHSPWSNSPRSCPPWCVRCYVAYKAALTGTHTDGLEVGFTVKNTSAIDHLHTLERTNLTTWAGTPHGSLGETDSAVTVTDSRSRLRRLRSGRSPSPWRYRCSWPQTLFSSLRKRTPGTATWHDMTWHDMTSRHEQWREMVREPTAIQQHHHHRHHHLSIRCDKEGKQGGRQAKRALFHLVASRIEYQLMFKPSFCTEGVHMCSYLAC